MSLFSSPHPLVPLATFNVSDGSTALEVVPSPSLLSSPPPGLPPTPMRLLDAEFEPKEVRLEPFILESSSELDANSTIPTYSLFPSQDPECDAPSRFSIFSPSASDSATPAAMPSAEGVLDGAPDFLGRLQHMKSLFRLSATEEPVSMMIHRVGPLLILDDGPKGWSRGEAGHSQPLPPPWAEPPGLEGTHEVEPQLMLAALDASLKSILTGTSAVEAEKERLTNIDFEVPDIDDQSSRYNDAIPSELRHCLCVKNTFVDVVTEKEDLDEFNRAQSAPACMAVSSPVTPPPSNIGQGWNLPLTPVVQRLQQQIATTEGVALARDAGSWSLIPYLPESNAPLQPTSGAEPSAKGSSQCGPRQWDLLQIASQQKLPVSCRTLEAMRALYAGIPPQPSRQGRAMEWRCGPYKILLGCDLVVFRTDDQLDVSKFASFKMLPPGASSEPTREERLDVYLENLMCNINTAVWGSDQQGQRTWRVFDTQDLPAARNGGEDEGYFDAESVIDQGQRLLHFLRQQCRREGGTYWLFREQNAKHAELFDLRSLSEASPEADREGQSYKRAFQTTESLVLPIASLCVHLAKVTPNPADQRALFQKSFSLLEPVKEEHPGLYASVALQLACSYMRATKLALPDSSGSPSAGVASEPPPAARLTVALRYLEGLLRLLTTIDDSVEDQMSDVVLRAQLLLEAHVAYAECIVKLVREAFVPTYSAWLADVQRSIQETTDEQGCSPSALIAEMKRLSAGFLIWRLFWLVRAQRALDFVPREKRETECWVLERDLDETMGDALYGLSRYPSDDADALLAGQMGTSEGLCELVSDGLKSWGSRGGTSCLNGASSSQRQQQSVPRSNGKKKSRRLTSPRSPEGCDKNEARPHDVTAIFLSQLNPLSRDFCDDVVCEDQLVNERLRPALWSEGVAFKTSLAFFEKAAGRLKKAGQGEEDGGRRRRSLDDQATLKIARKLAHLYNEEARSSLASVASGGGTEGVEELLTQAHEWMLLSGDNSNASRVLLNLNELYARRAEALAVAKGENGEPLPLTNSQYGLWLKAIECCEEAASLSENTLGRAEGAFAHLRVGVHLSLRVPGQFYLADATRREETLADLADRHFSKALRGFDDIKDEREVAVCHHHMADLVLQELRVPNAPPLSKARLISALRHARRSAEYWERVGALLYAKDFISAHLRISRLLEHQPRGSAVSEALEHLAVTEERLLTLARAAALGRKPGVIPGDSTAIVENSDLFIRVGGKLVAVEAFRREMSRVCQAGIRQGDDVDRLKKVYRLVLKNEPVHVPPASSAPT